MAKKEATIKIVLECGECKMPNYTTTKNKIEHPDKMVLRKYCKKCRKHTEHKERK